MPDPGYATLQSLPYVSHETLERLDIYNRLLRKWQPTINLVGPRTLETCWTRHFLDSAQLFPFLPDPAEGILLDFGSGAGFPAMVLALMGYSDVHLVESDHRKAAFLTEVSRCTHTPITLHRCRIEQLVPFPCRLITARAFAPLSKILTYAAPFIDHRTQALLLKGQSVDDELTNTHKMWTMTVTQYPSLTSSNGRILQLGDIHRVTETPDHSHRQSKRWGRQNNDSN